MRREAIKMKEKEKEISPGVVVTLPKSGQYTPRVTPSLGTPVQKMQELLHSLRENEKRCSLSTGLSVPAQCTECNIRLEKGKKVVAGGVSRDLMPWREADQLGGKTCVNISLVVWRYYCGRVE